MYFNENPDSVALVPISWGIGENNQNAATQITYLGTHFLNSFSIGQKEKEEKPVDRSDNCNSWF